MGILNFISSIFDPVTKLVDDLHTSEEEKGKVQEALLKLTNEVTLQVIQYENNLLQANSKIIESEAKGESWLQRNWRPLTMLTFLVLVVADSFNWLPNRLATEAWALLQIGLGGYVIGRSAEKIVTPSMITSLKSVWQKG